jgi:hypothetical protein
MRRSRIAPARTRVKKVTGMMTLKTVFLGFLVTASALPAGARDAERMTIRVSPAIAFAPANLVVRTTIAADPDNRAVEIVAESTEFYRSSEIQLDGERAPRTSQFEFRSLPPGMYEVKAILRGASGERAAVRQQVNVIGSGAGR